MQEKHRPLPQVRLRGLNLAIILAACLLYALALYQTVRVGGQYRELIAATEDYIACEENAARFRAGSDYLTEQVRLYVVSAKREYMENYFSEANVTRRRDSALDNLRGRFLEADAFSCLQSALEASNRLMERDIYAMKLISEANGYEDATLPPEVRSVELSPADKALDPGGKAARAEELAFNLSYQEAKSQIYGCVTDFLKNAARDTGVRQAETAESLDQAILFHRIWLTALFLLSVSAFAVIAVLVVRPLKIYIKRIKDNSMFELIGSYEFKHLTLTYNSIYEIAAANREGLKKRAEQDGITGLLNRSAFFQRAEELTGAPNPIALLLLDVDRFKEINDSYGRGTGDLVLKKVGKLLSVEFRTTDTPARLGADEFAVLMMDVTPEQREVVRGKVERINGLLLAPDDGLPPLSLNVGVSFSPAGYTQALYDRADHTLLQIQRSTLGGCAFSEE